MDVQDHILTTRGITSEVRRDDEIVGHALLLDYDDTASYDRLLSDCKDLPGLTVTFESSPGSWHVWNATVRTVDASALAMLERKADPMHASVGYRRGRWTLRFGPKDRINSADPDVPEEYKSAPDPLTWWVNSTDTPQSAAHVGVAAARLAEAGVAEADTVRERTRDRCGPLVGTDWRLEQYMTLTDDLKAEVRDGGR